MQATGIFNNDALTRIIILIALQRRPAAGIHLIGICHRHRIKTVSDTPQPVIGIGGLLQLRGGLGQ